MYQMSPESWAVLVQVLSTMQKNQLLKLQQFWQDMGASNKDVSTKMQNIIEHCKSAHRQMQRASDSIPYFYHRLTTLRLVCRVS